VSKNQRVAAQNSEEEQSLWLAQVASSSDDEWRETEGSNLGAQQRHLGHTKRGRISLHERWPRCYPPPSRGTAHHSAEVTRQQSRDIQGWQRPSLEVSRKRQRHQRGDVARGRMPDAAPRTARITAARMTQSPSRTLQRGQRPPSLGWMPGWSRNEKAESSGRMSLARARTAARGSSGAACIV
jgi:hypothetical protein